MLVGFVAPLTTEYWDDSSEGCGQTMTRIEAAGDALAGREGR